MTRDSNGLTFNAIIDGERMIASMFTTLVPDVPSLLTTYGYWAIFACIAIESAGIPFPGETMLLVAAVSAGTARQLSSPGDRGGGEWGHPGR